MQRWEYITVNNVRASDISTWLNEKTAQGWEFVQAVAVPSHLSQSLVTLIFKRQVPA